MIKNNSVSESFKVDYPVGNGASSLERKKASEKA